MTTDKTPSSKVILLHGLHMHAFAMRPLAKKLTAYGFECHTFGYFSMVQTIAQHSQRLNDWLIKNFDQTTTFDLVGHSLGGLVIRDFVARYPDWIKNGRIHRIVTLGTPHAGSQVAKNLVQYFPIFVCKSYQGALDGLLFSSDILQGVDFGVIAGNKPAGLGQLVMKKSWKSQVHDGTVFLHETHFDYQKEHITLPYSHTGLIFSEEVAEQVASFLKNGGFKKA